MRDEFVKSQESIVENITQAIEELEKAKNVLIRLHEELVQDIIISKSKELDVTDGND